MMLIQKVNETELHYNLLKENILKMERNYELRVRSQDIREN